MTVPSDQDASASPPSGSALWGRVLLRLAVAAAVVAGALWLMSFAMGLLESLPEAGQDTAQAAIIAVALVVYAVLIATPFVPGLEIGVVLLIMRGASVAPAVYLATAAGLLLAYALGRRVPIATLERTFRDLRQRRAAQMLATYAALAPEERQAMLSARLPRWLSPLAVRFRFVTLAVLINTPGNALLGGGGGILLAAGLSRLFAPWQTVLTVFIAVLPLPIGFLLFGPLIFQ